ncbi:MAG: sigma-70 family RNA polymerase sigma factor [Sandaracinaceae bacterium]|nr:sigma-70 family RNA polymerase sigma factor [Sandaracinaceae bacterium]
MEAHATTPAPAQVDPIATLITAGQHRDAVAACARTHGAAIGRLCMALLGSQAEAEETAQEVLIAAHDAMSAYRGEGSVRAWLFGIARRKCAKKLEMRGRRERRLRLVHDADVAGQLPDQELETRRAALRVRDALETLKPSERDAVVLRYEGGLAYREIGEACGIDEMAARKRVSRALARMRQLLSSEDGQ